MLSKIYNVKVGTLHKYLHWTLHSIFLLGLFPISSKLLSMIVMTVGGDIVTLKLALLKFALKKKGRRTFKCLAWKIVDHDI